MRVAVFVALGVCVGVGVGKDVDVGATVNVGVTVLVLVTVGVVVAVAVGFGVAVSVGAVVGVCVAVGTAVAVCVDVAVWVAIAVAVGLGTSVTVTVADIAGMSAVVWESAKDDCRFVLTVDVNSLTVTANSGVVVSVGVNASVGGGVGVREIKTVATTVGGEVAVTCWKGLGVEVASRRVSAFLVI